MSDGFEITVRLFGRHRELAGGPEITVELLGGATVGELRRALAAHPVLADLTGGAAIAVNRRYAPDEASVFPGDEVAVIPPVAGG